MSENNTICDDRYSDKCNKFLLKQELEEHNLLHEVDENSDLLYPSLNDPNFIIKIAEKKEFNDTKYDGEIHDIKEWADKLSNAEFELAPHQAFVRNFLSFQTPYNSLLLYHGLGSGKTCSAIGVCEEMRAYLKQMGISKRIIIVASPNVQDNFRTQLFDERRLKLVDGNWKIEASCTGNSLIKEVNPTSMKNFPREKIISQIKGLINQYYLFLGYDGFANYIIKTRDANSEFMNRLIVIDEVHNIRITDDNENKKVAIQLMKLVKSVDNLRLLLLSATPMYNNFREIIWLLNLMNANDRRGLIENKDIFDANGNFKSGGEELLIRKATGYVSFVRGENPYTFPFRIFPNIFSPENTFMDTKVYPKYQLNGKQISSKKKIKVLKEQLFLTTIGSYQELAYKFIVNALRKHSTSKDNLPNFENMESFGYTLLRMPLEALIITYPLDELEMAVRDIPAIEEEGMAEEEEGMAEEEEGMAEEDEEEEPEEEEEEEEGMAEKKGGAKSSSSSASSSSSVYIDTHDLTGKQGLRRIMKFVDSTSPPEKGSFEYKTDKYGRMFSQDQIGKYSNKIKYISEKIMNSEGIILIFSEYIDSGLIPMTLALEEMGIKRATGKSLFKTPPPEKASLFKYVLITGDPRISPKNDEEVKMATSDNNQDGAKVKVILISKAGSEGLDFKFIRQVHILEPWYTMNRIEQIIGRAVRNFSHKQLPFEKRNVEIYMHATLLNNSKEEAADLYVYRVAEYKAVQVGKISRLLKESAVDCILNHDQTNFTQEAMATNVKQILSSGKVLEEFAVGDVPNTAACDYMDTCEYKCRPTKEITKEDINENTYNESFVLLNLDKILQKIRQLMKERFFYKKKDLIQLINIPKPYPLVQIYAALSQLVDDNNETIRDKYGRIGYLTNIDEYYLFQPNEITNPRASIFERSVPVDYKHSMIEFNMKDIELEKEKEKEKEKEPGLGPEPGLEPEPEMASPELEILPREDTEERKEEPDGYEKEMVKGYEREAEAATEHAEEERTLLAILKDTYDTAISHMSESALPRGEKDWYKHCGIVMQKMMKENEISREELIEYLIQHIIDVLLFDEKKMLLNYLTKKTVQEEMSEFEVIAKAYFEQNIITDRKIKGIYIFDVNINKLLILDNLTQSWKDGEPEDERDLSNANKEKMATIQGMFNDIVGFIAYEQKYEYLVFKVKDMKAKRNTGARCDQASKSKTIVLLNKIVEMGVAKDDTYTKENTKKLIDVGLCILEEFILRHYNKDRKNGKVWFLNPELAKIYKF